MSGDRRPPVRVRQLEHPVGQTNAPTGPWPAANTTIPILRVFSVERAKQSYVDFLGCRLDFGGPSGGEGTPFYGQVSRAATTLQLTETEYDANLGSTVLTWMSGIEELHHELNTKRESVKVWGPAVWVPWPEETPWGALSMTIGDPFGNHLRFNEPTNPAERANLPRWASRHPS